MPDYYLLTFADASGFYGAAKVSLEGDPLEAVETPLVRLPSDADIQRILVDRGLKRGTAFHWIAVTGHPALGANHPFAPLAEAERGDVTIYINCALRVFVPDASGPVFMTIKDREVRLRETR